MAPRQSLVRLAIGALSSCVLPALSAILLLIRIHLCLEVCSVVKIQHMAQYWVHGSASLMSGDSRHLNAHVEVLAPEKPQNLLLMQSTTGNFPLLTPFPLRVSDTFKNMHNSSCPDTVTWYAI